MFLTCRTCVWSSACVRRRRSGARQFLLPDPFSYALFDEGYSGLSITIGAHRQLFITMQSRAASTGRALRRQTRATRPKRRSSRSKVPAAKIGRAASESDRAVSFPYAWSAGRAIPPLRSSTVIAAAARSPERAPNFYLASASCLVKNRRGLAIYAFCRTVDDVADGAEASSVRLTKLEPGRPSFRRVLGRPDSR